MHLIRQALLRLRAIVNRRALEGDMQSEMREHLDRATQRYMARGMSRADARIAARREFGNVSVLQEEARDARGARWLDALGSDLRFAFRYFARHKATSAIIVTVLALGIGTNTAIFSAFQAEMKRPAPTVPRDPLHVRVHASEQASRGARWRARDMTYPELTALAEHRDIFQDIAAFIGHDVVLDAGDSTGARGVGAEFVTPNYFSLLGVPLAAGPGFARGQPDVPDLAAVMSFNMAQLLYGDARQAVGRRILVNEIGVRVVGVAIPGFQGALRNAGRPALWLPISARAEIARVSPRWLDRTGLVLIGRLTSPEGHERATALARQVVTRALPDSAARVGMARSAWVLPMHEPAPLNADYESLFVLTAVGFIGLLILLVACTNVSSLMVAAAIGRRHEIAVRLSLGASRSRILKQLLTETTLLSVAGGLAGLMLYWWLATYIANRGIIQGVDIGPDLGTFAFMMSLAVGTGLLFGLSPALHATRAGVATALRDSGAGSTRRSRLQRVFVIAQIVFSQPLLVLLGVMLSLVITDYDPMPESVSDRVVSIGFRPLASTGSPSQRREGVDSLMTRIASHPEVVGVLPEVAAFAIRSITVPGERGAASDSAPRNAAIEGTAPGWFALLDVPIILGRDVSLDDTAATDYPIVVGSDLARKLWGEENPIGRTLTSPGRDGPAGSRDSADVVMTVVGVFDASRPNTRGDDIARLFTARGKGWRRDRILVRTRGGAEAFIPELRRLIRAEAPSLPVTEMQTLAQIDANEVLVTIKVAALAGGGAALALLLASLGLYGVISLAVNQRRREIGIRIAVGARPMRVARMFLASGVRVSAIALLIGLPVSVGALQLALAQGAVIAPDVNVWLIGTAIAVVLLLVAAAATWIPARRAALVDPATTLRVE